jgi:hypothetical protein
MHTHTMSPDQMKACIDACSTCHQTCMQTAMNHCLEAGGKHVEPAHFRLMMNCAQLCQVSVNFQLSSSTFSAELCGVCAQLCDACADSCDSIGGMDACVAACRACAESCRIMAKATH